MSKISSIYFTNWGTSNHDPKTRKGVKIHKVTISLPVGANCLLNESGQWVWDLNFWQTQFNSPKAFQDFITIFVLYIRNMQCVMKAREDMEVKHHIDEDFQTQVCQLE